MQQVAIHNLNRSHPTPILARYCDSFLCRLRGLTFCRNLEANRGLLLVQERESRLDASIHMLFMRMDLAVVWINSQMEVVDVIIAHRWRLAYLPARPARYVLELATENLDDFKVGERVRFEEA